MKIQAIVPLYPDPLICELYVRNFVKYKKKHIDRLIILVKEHQTTSGRIVHDDNGNVIEQIEYGRDNFKRHIESLKKLLAKHNITNYKLVDTLPDVEHGVMFHHVIDDIRDENYHTFFDEQDAYWLNDDFEQISSQLSEYDVIGGEKSVFHFLKRPEHLELFNKKHGLNHTIYPQKLHLPEFLSNRIIKRIDNFCCKSKWIDGKVCVEHMEFDQAVEFDTFQSLNLQIYKITDKIKLYEENRWDVLHDLVTHGYEHYNCNIDLDKYILYHCFSISGFAWATLFRDSTMRDLKQNFLRATVSGLGWEVKTMMQYQFCKYHCLDFEYRNEYMGNFDKIQTLDLTDHDSRYTGELFNLQKYDCSKLIERII